VVAIKSPALMKQIVETPTNLEMSVCPGGTTCSHNRPPGPQTWLLSTTPPQLCLMSLADARIAGRTDPPMRAHECRSFRDHSSVLREGLVPPVVETANGEVHVRRKLLVVQPFARSGESLALWAKLLVRIHFVVFRSGST